VIETEDLFLGALGLVRGGELRDIEVRGLNGRRLAVFCIEGPAMAEVEREYHRGPSLVDLRLLKSEVARLKNMAFDALRREEMRDAGQQRGHRAHQGSERPGRGRR
jgi:hypothetical protein